MQMQDVKIVENEPMSAHTTFRIGGPARYYMIPENAGQVSKCMGFAMKMELPYVIVGKGSNVLFSDEGYPGVVIEVGRSMADIEVSEDGHIRAGAGAGLGALAAAAAKQSLSGLEFASGIPGTVGGAVVMNAGAYGGEIKDCIKSAKVLDKEGAVLELSRDEMELGYRSSVIQRRGYIVTEAVFQLHKGNKEQILGRMSELNAKRREKQPLDYPSAGSTFKRPEGYFAGKLIEDAGLRGFQVGDAQVSEKHCGFVINRGKDTAADVIGLMEEVQKRVLETSGVRLEPEVKIIRG